eukprot:200768-Amorphochlora_amoeboformis.AAC.1
MTITQQAYFLNDFRTKKKAHTPTTGKFTLTCSNGEGLTASLLDVLRAKRELPDTHGDICRRIADQWAALSQLAGTVLPVAREDSVFPVNFNNSKPERMGLVQMPLHIFATRRLAELVKSL